MSLLQRENSRDGGGSQENRHSLAENLNFDVSQFFGDAAAPKANLSNENSRDGGGSQENRHSLAENLNFDVSQFFGDAAAPKANLSNSSWLPEGEPLQWQDGRVLYRRASSCGAPERGSVLTWSGVLPPRCTEEDPAGGFSSKVFLGGLPRNFCKQALRYALLAFQPVCVEWPGDSKRPRGCAFVTLESQDHVRALLQASRRNGTRWLYRVNSHAMCTKDVEVIPWAVADSHWMYGAGPLADGAASLRLEPSRTVFVGGLHGIITASALALIMNDLFPGVVYVGIDMDKTQYPIGSGRVTFSNRCSYFRAVAAGHVEIRTGKFTKKIQVDPYLEDSMCSICKLQQGLYFCREPVCFRYFCRSCWMRQHPLNNHTALMRNYTSVTLFNVGNDNNNRDGSSNSYVNNGRRQSAGEMCHCGFTQIPASPLPSTSARSAECGDSPLAPDWAP